MVYHYIFSPSAGLQGATVVPLAPAPLQASWAKEATWRLSVRFLPWLFTIKRNGLATRCHYNYGVLPSYVWFWHVLTFCHIYNCTSWVLPSNIIAFHHHHVVKIEVSDRFSFPIRRWMVDRKDRKLQKPRVFNKTQPSTFSGWWLQPLRKIWVNGKDYSIYSGKWNLCLKPPSSFAWRSLAKPSETMAQQQLIPQCLWWM